AFTSQVRPERSAPSNHRLRYRCPVGGCTAPWAAVPKRSLEGGVADDYFRQGATSGSIEHPRNLRWFPALALSRPALNGPRFVRACQRLRACKGEATSALAASEASHSSARRSALARNSTQAA